MAALTGLSTDDGFRSYFVLVSLLWVLSRLERPLGEAVPGRMSPVLGTEAQSLGGQASCRCPGVLPVPWKSLNLGVFVDPDSFRCTNHSFLRTGSKCIVVEMFSEITALLGDMKDGF